MLTETVVLISMTLLLIYGYIKTKWNVLRKWNIPHDPPSLRNLGHAALLFGRNSMEYELQCKKKFGDIWGGYIMTRPRIIIHDLEMIRQIMIKDFSNFHDRFGTPQDFGTRGLGYGLLVATGTRWKRIRLTINPMFSNLKLGKMKDIVGICIGNTMRRLKSMTEAEHNSIDVKDLFNRLSLDVICSTAFSINVNSQDDTVPEPEISRRARMFFEVNTLDRIRLFINLSFPTLGQYLSEGNRGSHITYLKHVCEKLLTDRERINNSETQSDRSARKDIMQAMISCRKPLDEMKTCASKGLADSEITHNAITMLLAGYDTTAIAMTYFAYNLANHGEVQAKLQAEIDCAFADNKVMDLTTVNNLKYLEMCVNESLRLYCPVASTIRTASQDVSISGLNIPKGGIVSIPLGALCRDPELWEDPLTYTPERMEDMQNIDSVIFQPFGTGPRSCIGMKFALMEIKLTFCSILRKYSFRSTNSTPKPPLVLEQGTTTIPVGSIILHLSPRT